MIGSGSTQRDLLALQSTNNHAQLRIISESSTYSSYIKFQDNSGAAERYFIQADPSDNLLFRPQGTGTATSQIVFDSAGNMGIGTASPTTKLHVYGNNAVGSLPNLAAQFSATGTGGLGIGDENGIDPYIGLLVATDDFHIKTGGNNNRITVLSGGNVGIGTTSPGYTLEVNGAFAATTKSFVIDHPTKENMRLQYASLEGPENGVYVRGRSTYKIIDLPHYWTNLVDEESITVQLTPIKNHQHLYVEKIRNNQVFINTDKLREKLNYYYIIHAERKDVEKLKVEIDA